MPQPYDYTVQRPDMLGGFAAYNQGQEDTRADQTRQRASAFGQYFPAAMKGDQAAQEQAFANATPEQAMQLQQSFSKLRDDELQQQAKTWDVLGALTAGLDPSTVTPKQWKQVQDRAVAFGWNPEFVGRATPADIPSLRSMSDTYRGAIKMQMDARETEANLGLKRAQTQSAYASADASRATADFTRAGGRNIDPFTGRRIPPPSIQNFDAKQQAKFDETADAAQRAANDLRSAAPALQRLETGPGTPGARTAAGAYSVAGSLLSPVTGSLGLGPAFASADEFVTNFDAIEQASKSVGIQRLQEIGGSDTERELLTAIQTTVNNSATPQENQRRFNNQLMAADILGKKSELAAQWRAQHGSLQWADQQGRTWQSVWRAFQRQAWDEFIRAQRQPQRGGAAQSAPQGGRAPEQSRHLPGLPPGFEVDQ